MLHAICPHGRGKFVQGKVLVLQCKLQQTSAGVDQHSFKKTKVKIVYTERRKVVITLYTAMGSIMPTTVLHSVSFEVSL